MWKIKHCPNFPLRGILIFLIFQFAALLISAQKLAVIAPESSELGEQIVRSFQNLKNEKLSVLDHSLSKAAFQSSNYENAFNLTLADARNIGQAVGADFFLLIRAGTTPRDSLSSKSYFESYAAIYLVSSRTGRLVLWKLAKGEARDAAESNQKLFQSIEILKSQIVSTLFDAQSSEIKERDFPEFESLPDESKVDNMQFQTAASLPKNKSEIFRNRKSLRSRRNSRHSGKR